MGSETAGKLLEIKNFHVIQIRRYCVHFILYSTVCTVLDTFQIETYHVSEFYKLNYCIQ